VAIRVRFFSVLLVLLAGAGCGAGRGGPASNLFFAAFTGATSGQLSSQGRSPLLAMIDEGRVPDLQCSNFADFRIPAKSFYESVGGKPVWLRDGQPTSQAQQLITLLQNADKKGLDPDDYGGPKWASRVETLEAQKSESDQIRFDLALTLSAMRYASDLHVGRVDPHQLGLGFDVNAKKIDLAEFLKRNVIDASDVAAAFLQLEPAFPEYQRTEQALEVYEKLAQDDDANAGPFPVTKSPLKAGDPYPETERLTRFLQGLGDLPPNVTIPDKSHVYQGEVVQGIKHFQERYGLPATGRIDEDTFHQLNRQLKIPLATRVSQLQLALERWRWLPFGTPQPLIVVNVPEFQLRAFDEEYNPVLTMKVLVGKAQTNETPLFASRMKSVVFRPYWNVPASIERAELLPAIERDGGYISNHSYEVVDSRSRVVSGGANVVSGLRSGQLSIRQRPGARNALGLVKFVFPNRYDVYMHDTPAVRLFSKARRDFTHGCIRVQEAEELAEWVLRFNTQWSSDAIHSAMQGSKTVPVSLVNPFSVFIVYMTTIVLENGEVHFFNDIYGQDEALRQALARREACSA
jgi:L,D-transpeptidase YcbB